MKIGIVGLGKMGHAIALRLLKAGHVVVGFDMDVTLREQLSAAGGHAVGSLAVLCQDVSVVWLMVPVSAVDDVVTQLLEHLTPTSTIVDGGNSFYKDSIARAQRCTQKNISFLDCGTSGGIHGAQHGFCLMVGGARHAYDQLKSVWHAIAAADGVAHIGDSGAGHYVKMVHNGIEYGILQAYAEGFHLLKDGSYKDSIDLAQVADLWNHGSVIRSFILQLAAGVLHKDQRFDTVEGSIHELGTGQWTLQEAHARNIPTPVLENSLQVRAWSRETGGNYATKFVALLRNAFGGHAVKKRE